MTPHAYVVLVDVTDHGYGDPDDPDCSQMLTEHVMAADPVAASAVARAKAIDALTDGVEGSTGPFTAFTTPMLRSAHYAATGHPDPYGDDTIPWLGQ